MRSIILLSAGLLLSAAGLSAQSTFNPTVPASGFNVFTRSAVHFGAGDTHGPVATGGDAILNGSTIVSMNYSGYYPYGNGASSNYGLVIGGRVWYMAGNQTQLNRGQLRIGSLTGTNLYQVNASSTATQVQLSAGAQNSNPNIQSNSTMPLNSANTGNGLNFAVAFSALRSYSNIISNYSTTHVTSSAINFLNAPRTAGGGSQTITIERGKVNYMNLTGAQMSAMESSGITYVFSETLDSSTVVVFNIAVKGTYNWSPAAWGAISDNSLGDGRFILYNFPLASRINLVGGRSSIGSILAPDAAVYKTGGNNAAGTIIADSFSLQYGEVHYAPFAGQLPGTGTALGVEELGLSGTESNGAVALSWRAVGLDAGATLQMERSLDGSRFERCAVLAPDIAGTWSEQLPLNPGRVLYRLRAVSGGATAYSPVWSARIGDSPVAVAASPNPFTTFIEIRNQSAPASWELLDMRGARAASGLCSGSCRIGDLGALPAGAYLLRISDGGRTTTLPVMKQ